MRLQISIIKPMGTYTSFNNFYMPLKEDFIKAAYNIGRNKNALINAWGGNYLGFYSSFSTVNQTKDIGNRSYAVTGYLKPNLRRPNLRVLAKAYTTKSLYLVTKPLVYNLFIIKSCIKSQLLKKVILSSIIIQILQLLELSGIKDPEVLCQVGVHHWYKFSIIIFQAVCSSALALVCCRLMRFIKENTQMYSISTSRPKRAIRESGHALNFIFYALIIS